jgi:hypothetical protein
MRQARRLLVRYTRLTTVALLVACGATAPPPAPAPGVFDHRAATAHVELYWTCTTPEPGRLRLAGIAENRWHPQPVGFLELDLVGVDARNRTVAEATAALADMQLGTNQRSPFRLDLRTTGREVRYDLFCQYRFFENELDAGRSPAGVRLAQQNQRFMLRDVCGPAQHRSHAPTGLTVPASARLGRPRP